MSEFRKIDGMQFWIDGICKCGSIVIQQSDVGGKDSKDYRNMCTNKDCSQHKWHQCYDDQFLGYYKHRGCP